MGKSIFFRMDYEKGRGFCTEKRIPSRRGGPLVGRTEHYLVGQYQQQQLPTLRPITARLHRRCQATLQHRIRAFHLPALPVAAVILVQPSLHLSSIATAGRFGGRPADLGRHEGTYPLLLAGIAMVRLRVVAGIGQHRVEAHVLQGRVHQGHEAVGIRARAAPRRPR